MMKTKSKKVSDPRVRELVSKAFDLSPDCSQSRMFLGDAYRGTFGNERKVWSDKKMIDTLEGVRINPLISGECADQINQALEILKAP